MMEIVTASGSLSQYSIVLVHEYSLFSYKGRPDLQVGYRFYSVLTSDVVIRVAVI